MKVCVGNQAPGSTMMGWFFLCSPGGMMRQWCTIPLWHFFEHEGFESLNFDRSQTQLAKLVVYRPGVSNIQPKVWSYNVRTHSSPWIGRGWCSDIKFLQEYSEMDQNTKAVWHKFKNKDGLMVSLIIRYPLCDKSTFCVLAVLKDLYCIKTWDCMFFQKGTFKMNLFTSKLPHWGASNHNAIENQTGWQWTCLLFLFSFPSFSHQTRPWSGSGVWC